MQRIHADDRTSELAGITELSQQWTTFRNLLNPTTLTAQSDAGSAAQLTSAYQPLANHIGALIARENGDGREDQARASASSARARWMIAVAVIAAILATIGLGWTAIRRLRHAVEPGEDQIEFADTLQLAEDEDEAHQLLQRHLERTVAHSTVTVLNRNNSADRLEAVTALPANSPLIATARARRAPGLPGRAVGAQSRRGQPSDRLCWAARSARNAPAARPVPPHGRR